MFNHELIQKWKDSVKASNELIAETAFSALLNCPNVTSREFVAELRKNGIQGNTQLLSYALGQAKVSGSTEKGVANLVGVKRDEIAQKQLEKQQESARKKAIKDEQKELQKQALTDPQLAAELATENLKTLRSKMDAMNTEMLRIFLEWRKAARALRNANMDYDPCYLKLDDIHGMNAMHGEGPNALKTLIQVELKASNEFHRRD